MGLLRQAPLLFWVRCSKQRRMLGVQDGLCQQAALIRARIGLQARPSQLTVLLATPCRCQLGAQWRPSARAQTLDMKVY